MECVPTVPITRVWPSPGDLATLSAPMLPPAPGRLSTTTGKPSWAFSLNKRARMSGAPPEGKVTTRRKGLVGKACAEAPTALKAPNPSNRPPRLRRMGLAMRRAEPRADSAEAVGVAERVGMNNSL